MVVDPSTEGSKVCSKCKERKLLYNFYGAFTKGRINSWCKECKKTLQKGKQREYKAAYYKKRKLNGIVTRMTPEERVIATRLAKINRKNSWERFRVHGAKKRAKLKNLSFNLTADYIKSITPSDMICPALGIQMKVGQTIKEAKIISPSLDRLIPELGYVKGNVVVVSNRANTIKRDATPEELMKIAKFYEKVFKEQNPRQLALDL